MVRSIRIDNFDSSLDGIAAEFVMSNQINMTSLVKYQLKLTYKIKKMLVLKSDILFTFSTTPVFLNEMPNASRAEFF